MGLQHRGEVLTAKVWTAPRLGTTQAAAPRELAAKVEAGAAGMGSSGLTAGTAGRVARVTSAGKTEAVALCEGGGSGGGGGGSWHGLIRCAL